jgi:hypothetical protein
MISTARRIVVERLIIVILFLVPQAIREGKLFFEEFVAISPPSGTIQDNANIRAYTSQREMDLEPRHYRHFINFAGIISCLNNEEVSCRKRIYGLMSKFGCGRSVSSGMTENNSRG